MQREIKFRGKRLDNREWVWGWYFRTGLNRHYIKSHSNLKDYEVDPATVGQYAGMKDRNGREIYEHDPVTINYGRWHEEPAGLTRQGTVIYDKKSCAFVVAVKDSKVLVPMRNTSTIGIIHDKEATQCTK